MAKRPRAYCLADNRESNESGLRLAIASLTKHCTGSRIFVFRPNPTREFVDWLTGFSVELVRECLAHDGGDSKARALLDVLERGWSEVTWLDPHVIVSRNCNLFFESVADELVVLAKVPASNICRGAAIGHSGQEPDPVELAMDSPVMRVTSQHVDFLKRCLDVLDENRQNAFRVSEHHALSDGQPYRQCRPDAIRIRVLKNHAEILHCQLHSGYSIHDRVSRLIFGKPLFVHAMDGAELRDGPQTSPYVLEARRYEWEVRTSR